MVLPATLAPASAVPSNNRAYAGYGDVTTNGFGGSDSWGGSFGLFTGQNQSGEFIPSFCIQRGLSYPRGLDPQFADANSGFTQVSDLPAERGVSATDRAALSYALWKYGSSADSVTAGAMFMVSHVMSADPTFGSSSLEATVMGGDWPNGAAVKNRAIAIRNEAIAKRGPWNLDVTIVPSGANRTANITLTGPGGPIAGEQVMLGATNISGAPSSVTTNASGRASFNAPPADIASPIRVTASVQSPAPYRVFRGAANTQTVVTGGGSVPVTDRDEADPPFARRSVSKRTTNPVYQSGEGARFEVHQGDANGPVVAVLTSGPNGLTNVADELEPGIYTLIEVYVPEGQVLNPVPRELEVLAGSDAVVDVLNQVEEDVGLSLLKLDDETDETLAGAVFSVFADRDGNGSFEDPVGDGPDGIAADDPATEVDESADNGQWVTEETPLLIDGLIVGAYEVTEVAPPPGYTLPEIADRSQVIVFTYGDTTTPDDNVLEFTASIRNRQPAVRTQVVVPAVLDDPDTEDVDESSTERSDNLVEAGSEIADRVIVENVASDVSGVVTAELFGPFDGLDSIVCSDETLFGSETFEVLGSGVFVSPGFPVDEPGVYTFVETWEGSDGSSASHECGEVTETVFVPDIRTEVSAQESGLGVPLFDTAIVSGVAPTTPGVITVQAFGPFETVECAATGVAVEDGSQVGVCLPAECVDAEDVEGCDPEVTYAQGAAGGIECTADLLAFEATYEVEGPGEFPSPEFVPDVGGIYTFVEVWTEQLTPDQVEAGDTPVEVSHECGLTAETTIVQPEIATSASADALIVPGQIHDTSVLSGVADGVRGSATFSLFGPFESEDAMVCDESTLMGSQVAETVGSGDHESPEFDVSEPGVYTFVETWESESGEMTATHACGELAETFTASRPDRPTLPRTGTATGQLFVAGLVLLIGGVALVLGERRMRTSV